MLLRSASPGGVDRGAVEIVADGALVATAIPDAALRPSLEARVESTTLAGDGATAVLALASSTANGLRIFAGETTVQVAGSGLGGRNQHAALTLRPPPGRAFGNRAGVRSGGIDARNRWPRRPSGAARALVDHHSVRRINAEGLDPRALLDDDASHQALDAAGDLVRSGPTGIDVGDLWLLWS